MTRAVRARMPPSPWLSARITRSRYLIEMTMINAQNASDAMPSALSSVTGRWWCSNDSLKAYSGLVPMSPKTTPRAPRARAPMPMPVPWPGAVSPRNSAFTSSAVGWGALAPSAVGSCTSRAIGSRPYFPLHGQEAAETGDVHQRLALADAAAHHQGADGRRRGLVPPLGATLLDQPVDAVQGEELGLGAHRIGRRELIDAHLRRDVLHARVDQVVATALVADERAQPLPPRTQRQLGGAGDGVVDGDDPACLDHTGRPANPRCGVVLDRGPRTVRRDGRQPRREG